MNHPLFLWAASTRMGPKSPSRQLQPSHSQDLGGPAGHVPSPMPIACMRSLEAFQRAGGRSDPHVSKPAFGVDSNGFCFQDLDRPSSHSKSDFLAWAAQTGKKKADFRGAMAQNRHEPSPFFYGRLRLVLVQRAQADSCNPATHRI